MSRQNKTSKKNRFQYIYYTTEGEKTVLTPGEDGVTEEDIDLLHELDDLEFDNNRVNENKQIRFEAMQSNDDGEDVSDRIQELADVKQDILLLLEQVERNSQLFEAIKTLLPQQKELIDELFFQGSQIIDIARRQGVSHVAVIDRLKRIYKKLEKNLE